MRTSNTPNSLVNSLRKALIIDLVAIPIMLGIWWLLLDSTITNLISIFLIVGILLMGAGGSYVGGSRSFLSDSIRKRSEGVTYSEEHIERDRKLQKKQSADSITYICAGIIPFSIAVILAIT